MTRTPARAAPLACADELPSTAAGAGPPAVRADDEPRLETAERLLLLGQYAAACDLLRRKLARDPDDSRTLHLLVRAVAASDGPDRALQLLWQHRAAGALDVDTAILQLELTVAAGQYDRAIVLGSALLRAAPDDVAVAAHLLDALELSSRTFDLHRLLALLADRPATRLLAGQRRCALVDSGGAAGDTQPAAPATDPGHDPARPVPPLPSGQPLLPADPGDLERILELFGGNEHVHARQVELRDGRFGYVPVHVSLSCAFLRAHLEGHVTLGCYLLDSSSRSRTLVFDLDAASPAPSRLDARESTVAPLRTSVSRLIVAADRLGVPLVLEDSGWKGFHLWAFFEPTPASIVRDVGRLILESASASGDVIACELFPKQDTVRSGGLGNLVKLPLGIHRASGRRALFLDPATFLPLADQAAAIRSVVPLDAACVDRILDLSRESRPSRGTIPARPSAPDPAAGPRIDPLPPRTVPERIPLPASLPPLVDSVLAGCGIMREIVGRARLGRTLTIHERHVLVHVFAHLGPDGRLFAHQVLAQGQGYDPDQVNRFLAGVSPHAISCRRIGELLPRLQAAAGCACPANLSQDAYPSPLVFAGLTPRSSARLPRVDRPCSEPALGALLAALMPRIRSTSESGELDILERTIQERRRYLEAELHSTPPSHPDAPPSPDGRPPLSLVPRDIGSASRHATAPDASAPEDSPSPQTRDAGGPEPATVRTDATLDEVRP
jgi:hypothetical protein